MEFDDEVCCCGHSKGYHGSHHLDKHGAECEKCNCIGYTWQKFIKYTDAVAKEREQ